MKMFSGIIADKRKWYGCQAELRPQELEDNDNHKITKRMLKSFT